MSFKVYYEHAKGCVARSIAFLPRTSKTSNVRGVAVYYDYLKVQHGRGNVFSVVRGCSKDLFGRLLGHGKSPCFFAFRILTVADVDVGLLISAGSDGAS
jgi:hypothetical protein